MLFLFFFFFSETSYLIFFLMREIINLVLKLNENKPNKCLLEYSHQIRVLRLQLMHMQLSRISSIPKDIFCLFFFNASSHNLKQTLFTIQRDSERSVTRGNPAAAYVNTQLHSRPSWHTQTSHQGAPGRGGGFRRQRTPAPTANTTLFVM